MTCFGRLNLRRWSPRSLLYDPDYIGGGTHENLPGQDLDPHVDFNYHPKTAWHRRLNLIVYLNPEWEEAWGGSLELHLDPWLPPEHDRFKRVAPIANRAVLFETSERSWHGFQAIVPPPQRPRLSRRSLALYMYTRERPREQTAPAHQTVYVPRPLPTVLRPDNDVSVRDRERIVRALVRRADLLVLLTQRDRQQAAVVGENVDLLLKTAASGIESSEIELIEAIFRREDELMKLLYEREKELAADLAALTAARIRPRPTRLPLRDPTAAVSQLEGLWPDLWAGRRLSFAIDAMMPTTTLTLRGRIPEAIASGQRLRCTIARNVTERQFSPGTFHWDLPFPASSGPVQVELSASEAVCPSRTTRSLDDRELAYELAEVVLSW
jgi:2-oxoglutarate-Fe(II)-dependent oxygenase superfamily protein